MSKTKNTPEFHKMLDDQELSASFHYQEQEHEKELLFDNISAEEAMYNATEEYIAAQKVFMEAQRKFSDALDSYKSYKGGLNHKEEEVSTTIDMLNDMFKGFDPNS